VQTHTRLRCTELGLKLPIFIVGKGHVRTDTPVHHCALMTQDHPMKQQSRRASACMIKKACTCTLPVLPTGAHSYILEFELCSRTGRVHPLKQIWRHGNCCCRIARPSFPVLLQTSYKSVIGPYMPNLLSGLDCLQCSNLSQQFHRSILSAQFVCGSSSTTYFS